jgi:hydroxymethylglutaryl-CoA lyase
MPRGAGSTPPPGGGCGIGAVPAAGCTRGPEWTSFANTSRAAGVPVRGYVSCVLGCPYEGPVHPDAVAFVAASLLELGCYEVSLGDTIGVGNAGSTARMLDAVLARVPADRVAVHCHDTYGQALANILVALQLGVGTVDASVAGLGGCPYAPGSTGNVATEDLLYMFDGLGIETGVRIDRVSDAARAIAPHLTHPLSSRYTLARR